MEAFAEAGNLVAQDQLTPSRATSFCVGALERQYANAFELVTVDRGDMGRAFGSSTVALSQEL